LACIPKTEICAELFGSLKLTIFVKDLPSNGTGRIDFKLSFSVTTQPAGDEYQGDSVTVTMDFKGNQDVSQ
jgi:hypothetical protein